MLKFTPTDDSAEVDGIWRKYRGVDLLIARDGNKRHKRVFAQLIKPYKKQIDEGSLDNETSEDLLYSAMAETILLNWKNAPNDVKYSKENARELLAGDRDLRDFVEGVAKDLNNYLTKEEEETLGE